MTDLEIRILSAPAGKCWMFYAGQAGYILKSSSGELLAVDVYFSECGERIEGHMGFKRLLPRLLDPAAIKYDYVIATHPHFDHFDYDAMPILLSNHDTKLVASVNCEQEIKKMGRSNENISYRRPGEHITLGDYQVDFTECDHGTLAPDAFGVVITVDSKRIYMAGDTCKRMDRVNDINEFGPFDVVIGPINGAYGNMNEEDFAEFSSCLDTKLTIPCHYGLFAWHGGDPGKFLRIMQSEYPERKVLIMAMGERLEL